MEKCQVVIIGSGPAGYTAAIYTARANLSPLLIEGGFVPGNQSVLPGGQLMITTDVENFPGFPEGIQGPELISRVRAQAERFGTRIVSGFVTKVDLSKRPFAIEVENADTFLAETVIIATGAVAKLLEVPGERELMGHGVSACATCDGAFFRGKKVVVVGGGDTALEESLFLTRFASSVTLIHRRDELRASKVMQERAKKNPKMHFLWNTVVERAIGTKPSKPGDLGGLTGLELRNVKSGERQTFDCDGLFVAIGHQPNSDLFRGQLDLSEQGYIRVEPGTCRTRIPGAFACGDVQDHVYRQAITAAGTGCMAAIEAERWLEANAGE